MCYFNKSVIFNYEILFTKNNKSNPTLARYVSPFFGVMPLKG